MQTEQNPLADVSQTSPQQQVQQQNQMPRMNAFGQSVFMGAGASQDSKTASGEGYAMGFLLPKQD